jgi:hypothetical protein
LRNIEWFFEFDPSGINAMAPVAQPEHITRVCNNVYYTPEKMSTCIGIAAAVRILRQRGFLNWQEGHNGT